MGKIFFMMGKSSSGKDTLFREISEKFPDLRTVVPYTTRPIRSDEQDGREHQRCNDKPIPEPCKEETEKKPQRR